MYNPSLREEPRDQRFNGASTGQQPSILDWLESSGRLLSRDPQDRELPAEDEEIEEINELMVGDEGDYLDEDEIEIEE
jgi:hypothetical protein